MIYLILSRRRRIISRRTWIINSSWSCWFSIVNLQLEKLSFKLLQYFENTFSVTDQILTYDFLQEWLQKWGVYLSSIFISIKEYNNIFLFIHTDFFAWSLKRIITSDIRSSFILCQWNDTVQFFFFEILIWSGTIIERKNWILNNISFLIYEWM